MASLPPIKKDSIEDFPEQRSWIERLLIPNNSFKSFVYNALNGQLTRSENMLGQIATLSVKTASDWTLPAAISSGAAAGVVPPPYAELANPLQFSVTMKLKPIGLNIIALTDTATNPPIRQYGVTADWSYANGLVTVNAISGLEPGHAYNVTFELIGG